MSGVLGRLELAPAIERPDLLATPVAAVIDTLPDADVAAIDPGLADTAALCEAYDVALDISANCVVVTGRRAGVERQAACVVLATTRADVNGLVRRRLDARKASFASVDFVTEATGMEYGGITPVGLPAGWMLLVDAAVADTDAVVIGSGLRRSKVVLPGSALADLPGAEIVNGLGRPAV
jgi:prolyl-tRNA editing enzyme YbaK/EbsC (Cys-tRNA(Pro) deacylase)